MSIKTHKKINFIIEGEPASKANSRKIVNFGKRMGVIKSKKLGIMKKCLRIKLTIRKSY